MSDTIIANRPKVSVYPARTLEDIAKVFAIRAAVFMSEQECPYEEEYDGNDFNATHLLAICNNEPVGTMRIRYFADWAKPERLAILRRFRDFGVADAIIEAGIELCRRKGYRRLYGHSQKRLLKFWRKFGFEPMEKPEFMFSDHEYVEIESWLDPHPNPVSMDDEPLATIRPEGAWDVAGVLDQSAVRGATNPL